MGFLSPDLAEMLAWKARIIQSVIFFGWDAKRLSYPKTVIPIWNIPHGTEPENDFVHFPLEYFEKRTDDIDALPAWN